MSLPTPTPFAAPRSEPLRALSTWWNLKIERTTPGALTADQHEELWRFACSIVKRDRAEFDSKLAKCPALWLVRSRAGGPVEGLSAVHVWKSPDPAEPMALLEVKWMWLAPHLRGLHLPVALGALALLWLAREHPNTRRFFVANAATEHTFMMLHRYLVAWPHPDREVPRELLATLEAGLRAMNGDDWDPKTGIVAGHGQFQYRRSRPPGVYGSPALDRLAAWYYARNPGHADGDCLTMVMQADARQAARAFTSVGRELVKGLAGLALRPPRPASAPTARPSRTAPGSPR